MIKVYKRESKWFSFFITEFDVGAKAFVYDKHERLWYDGYITITSFNNYYSYKIKAGNPIDKPNLDVVEYF